MPLTTLPTEPHAAPTGAPVELARYRLPTGERVLVGQRIGGLVALIDLPVGPEGRVYPLPSPEQQPRYCLITALAPPSRRRGTTPMLC